jgi:hypothetical protein
VFILKRMDMPDRNCKKCLSAKVGWASFPCCECITTGAHYQEDMNPIKVKGHTHKWKTDYLRSTGMKCSCGATLSQDRVEEIVNTTEFIWGEKYKDGK